MDSDALDYFLSPEPDARYFASREPNAVQWLADQREARVRYKQVEKAWEAVQEWMRA